MAQQGGKREGAGKPKGYKAPHTLQAQEARKVFIEKVNENLRPIFDALLAKATEGDVSAARELLDRAWGKPLQTSEVTNVKKMKLDDIETDKIAHDLAELQKADTRADS